MRVGKVKNYPWLFELVPILSGLYIAISAYSHWSVLPDMMADHFDGAGNPNGQHSKTVVMYIFAVFFVNAWATDFFMRYKFLFSEKEKRFNWISMFTSSCVIFLPWAWYILLDYNLNSGAPVNYHLDKLLALLLLTLFFNLILERYRKPTESTVAAIAPRPADALSLKNLDKFYYVDVQSPLWWVALSLVSSVIVSVGAVVMILSGQASNMPYLSVTGYICLFAAVVVLVFAKGFQYVVHPAGVDIKFGLLGIRIKHIPMKEIEEVSFTEFSPLADFGGWGFRYGRDNTTGYIISGTEGVLIKTKARNYVLSTSRANTMIELIKKAL